MPDFRAVKRLIRNQKGQTKTVYVVQVLGYHPKARAVSNVDWYDMKEFPNDEQAKAFIDAELGSYDRSEIVSQQVVAIVVNNSVATPEVPIPA